MRVKAYVILLFILKVTAFAHSSEDAPAIAYAKRISVSRIERGMPSTQFGVWFANIVGPRTPITWEVNDCGEQTGTPQDRGRDFPMCVEVHAQQAKDFFISVSLQVGTFKRGVRGKPVVRNIFLGENDNSGNYAKNLRDLDQQLKQRTKDLAYFDPNSGVFILPDDDKSVFNDYLQMWITTVEYDRRERSYPVRPYGGISFGATIFKFRKTFYDGTRWTFQTRIVDGTSYQFEGKFAKYKLDAHGAPIPENVLRGHMIKFVNGKKVAEADLTFSFQVESD
jgi:hypothetical protein